MLESYDDILTVDEACEALKIGKNALYDLLNSGALKAMRNGRVWRIPKPPFRNTSLTLRELRIHNLCEKIL